MSPRRCWRRRGRCGRARRRRGLQGAPCAAGAAVRHGTPRCGRAAAACTSSRGGRPAPVCTSCCNYVATCAWACTCLAAQMTAKAGKLGQPGQCASAVESAEDPNNSAAARWRQALLELLAQCTRIATKLLSPRHAHVTRRHKESHGPCRAWLLLCARSAPARANRNGASQASTELLQSS